VRTEGETLFSCCFNFSITRLSWASTWASSCIFPIIFFACATMAFSASCCLAAASISALVFFSLQPNRQQCSVLALLRYDKCYKEILKMHERTGTFWNSLSKPSLKFSTDFSCCCFFWRWFLNTMKLMIGFLKQNVQLHIHSSR